MKKMLEQYKVMRGCEYYISAKTIHASLLYWRNWYLKNPNIKTKIIRTEGLVKNKIRIYETHKNTVMPHGRHIYAKSYDMEKATICVYPQSNHALPTAATA